MLSKDDREFSQAEPEKLSISVIILTLNEEKNLERALQSISGWVASIYIVDSYSRDRTIDLARTYSAGIYQHRFENYSKQFNWALSNLPLDTDWVMRLDADEAVSPALKSELFSTLPLLKEDICGIYLPRRIYFLGRWIKHGAHYPVYLLRLWRNGQGCCEDRWMDEHIKISAGETIKLRGDICERNQNGLSRWLEKHNSYATREAIDLLNLKYGLFSCDEIRPTLLGTQDQRKRWIKKHLYARLPLFLRSLIYYIYRYFLRFGFLDGSAGLVFHFLQGFCYRLVVDAKILEIEQQQKTGERDIIGVINELHNIDLAGQRPPEK